MSRQREAFIEDIVLAIDKIGNYTSEMGDVEDLKEDQAVFEAVLFNLENIGEAAKNLSEEFKSRTDIEWGEIAGFRDMIVHQYFRADPDIVWDIIVNELPQVKEEVDGEVSS